MDFKAFCARVETWANMSMDDLRMAASGDEQPTLSSAREEFRGWNRGQLIVLLLQYFQTDSILNAK